MAITLVIVTVLWLLLMPQFVAVGLLSRERLTGEQKITLYELVSLWVTKTPSSVTGGEHDELHWLIVLLVLFLVVAGIGVTVWWQSNRAKNPQLKRGLAPVSAVVKELGVRQLLENGARFRPSLKKSQIEPWQVGYRLGEFQGVDCWLRIEDSMIVIGPARSGKGWHIVLNWILDAPGAVVTTSSKMDNVAMTMEARMKDGRRVWVFAPGIGGGDKLGHVLRWDPIAGCEDEEVLVRRIKALIPSGAFGGSTSNGGHWDTLGQQLASHLFHAAALAGENVDKLWEWVSNPQRAAEAVKIIREHPKGMPEHANHLESVINQPPEQRTSSWGTLPTVLAFMESRAARDWMKPDEGEAFDPIRFIFEKETLYLVGDKQTTGGYVRIIDGLLAELDAVTKDVADATEGTRIDPPVTYILDEAGNFEYQGLYELITAGGGRGRIVVAVFQSRKQLQQWGAENAETLWDAATAKIVLPGGSSKQDLEEMSALIGELWTQSESHSWGSGQGSVSVSEQKRSILEPAEIREMDRKYCLLFYRNMKPVIPQMRPFSEHPEFENSSASSKRLTQMIATKSQYAEEIKKYVG